MERIRAFIALNFSAGVIDKVAEVQRELRQAADTEDVRVTWVPPPNLHLTLKFLGDIPSESAFAVRSRLVDGLADLRAWPIEISGIGVFPSADRPRVVWIGLQDDGKLGQIAHDIDSWLNDLGFASETRPFHPHLTLGRIKQGNAAFWQGLQQRTLGKFKPSEVVLYRSELHSHGAEYIALARVSLGGAAQDNNR